MGAARFCVLVMLMGPVCFGGKENPDDLTLLSDEFDNSRTQSAWKDLGPAEGYPSRILDWDINTTRPSYMRVAPREGAWYGGYHGAFLFKEVRGDFVVWTRLRVNGRGGGIPRTRWTLSGLLARKPIRADLPPAQRGENWLYLMTGRGPNTSRVVDAKTTRNSEYVWDITPIPEGWVELAFVRIGNWFISYCRPGGGAWVVRKRTLRDDLPALLQVGVNMTAGLGASVNTPPLRYNAALLPSAEELDNVTDIDFVRFKRPAEPAALRDATSGRNLSGVTDGQLLRLLEQ